MDLAPLLLAALGAALCTRGRLDEVRVHADRGAQFCVLGIAEQDAIVPAQARDPQRQHGVEKIEVGVHGLTREACGIV